MVSFEKTEKTVRDEQQIDSNQQLKQICELISDSKKN